MPRRSNTVRGFLYLGLLLLALTLAACTSTSSVPTNVADESALTSTTPVPQCETAPSDEPRPTNTPTPRREEYGTPMPPRPTPTPRYQETLDLAPEIPQKDKVSVIIQSSDCTYTRYWIEPELSPLWLLQPGDRLVSVAPPASLMGQHPPTPTATPSPIACGASGSGQSESEKLVYIRLLNSTGIDFDCVTFNYRSNSKDFAALRSSQYTEYVAYASPIEYCTQFIAIAQGIPYLSEVRVYCEQSTTSLAPGYYTYELTLLKGVGSAGYAQIAYRLTKDRDLPPTPTPTRPPHPLTRDQAIQQSADIMRKSGILFRNPVSSPPQVFARQTVLAEFVWIAYGERYDELIENIDRDPATPVWIVVFFGDMHYTLPGFPRPDGVYPIYNNMIFVMDAYTGRHLVHEHYVPGCDPLNVEARDCGTPDIGYLGPTKAILDFVRAG